VSDFEVETTLLIQSERPREVAEQIAALEGLGPYRLLTRSDLTIRDVYVDLENNSLRSYGLGMRLRTVGGQTLVTMKGKPKHGPGGLRSREEIEMAWTPDALERVADRCAQQGLVLDTAGATFSDDEPLSVLFELGFVTDQIRTNFRRPRNLITSESPKSTLAELVVDSVVFHFASGDVRHYEVEIEVKEQGSPEVVQTAAEHLLARWPDDLRVWGHGKRSTGQAVERMVEEFRGEGLIGSNGDLQPQAYDLLKDILH